MKSFLLFFIFSNLFISEINIENLKQTQEKPEIAFAGKRGYESSMSNDEIKIGSALGCFIGDENYAVLSFDMSVKKGNSLKTSSSKDMNLTAEQKQQISDLPSGSKIIFSNVKVKLTDGKMITIGPKTITVKK